MDPSPISSPPRKMTPRVPPGTPLRDRVAFVLTFRVIVPVLARLRSAPGPLGRYLRKRLPAGVAFIPAGWPLARRRKR
jgi:hypothetical protein